MIQIRKAIPSDAPAISALIRDLVKHSIIDNYEEASKKFWESISEDSERKYIEDSSYKYLVAVDNDTLVGCIVMRDNKHLAHLFVAKESQGKGLASKLWHEVKSQVELEGYDGGHDGGYTVNSSLEAIKIYEHFGFHMVGELKREDGIVFQPMEM